MAMFSRKMKGLVSSSSSTSTSSFFIGGGSFIISKMGFNTNTKTTTASGPRIDRPTGGIFCRGNAFREFFKDFKGKTWKDYLEYMASKKREGKFLGLRGPLKKDRLENKMEIKGVGDGELLAQTRQKDSSA